MGHRDSVSQIKAVFNYRKKMLKDAKTRRALIGTILLITACAFGVFVYAKDTVKIYNEKNETLEVGIQNLENEKDLIKEEKEVIEQQKEEIKNEQERLLTEAEQLAKNNQSLI